jgi:membrane protease YdiL (CAAX protease family)
MKLVSLNKVGIASDVHPGKNFDLRYQPQNPIIYIGSTPDNDIVLLHSSIAPRHLAVVIGSWGLTIWDTGSENGTWVNSERLLPEKSFVLIPGDTLRLGNVTLAIEHSEDQGKFSFYNPTSPAPVADSKVKTGGQTLPKPEYLDRKKKPGSASNTGVAWDLPLSTGWEFLKRRTLLVSARLPWVYLLVISLAEIFTNLVNYQFGLFLHAGLLLWLIIHGALGKQDAERRLALALVVAPLIRLLSLSLPINDFPQLWWYPMVAVPLLLAASLIIRQLGLSRRALGFKRGNLLLQLMLACGGLGLGAMEYSILRPNPLINSLSWEVVLVPALILIIFTGFNEELIFRGLLQATSLRLLGRWSLVYVSLIFAVLHIGYKSWLDVVFVFGVGLLFSYIVLWGGSILGVTLAHGLTNVMLFLVLPFINQTQTASSEAMDLVEALVWTGTGVALLAIGILTWKAWKDKALLGPEPDKSFGITRPENGLVVSSSTANLTMHGHYQNL